MPIVTRAEVKTILQIPTGDTSKDALIDALIPLVQDFVVEYCSNQFKKTSLSIVSSHISFSSSSKKIESSSISFTDEGFRAGIDIIINGSLLNDGYYSIKSVASGFLELNESLIDEAEGEFIEITLVKFPAALKRTVAKMIGLDLNKSNVAGNVSSISLGDFSETFNSNYPENILLELDNYKKLDWD